MKFFFISCLSLAFLHNRNGIYPLTAYAATYRPVVQQELNSPDVSDPEKASYETYELETRRIVNIMCNVKPQEESQNLTVCLKPLF